MLPKICAGRNWPKLPNNRVDFTFFVASFAAFILLCPRGALAQTTAGSVTSIVGGAQIARAGITSAAAPGMALDVGDRVITGIKSRVTITLSDKSQLELAESTTLLIDEHVVTNKSRSTRLSLFSGLVRSFVAYRSSDKPTFEVHTPNAIAGARGTKFETGTDTAEHKEYEGCHVFTEVSVFEGTVEVVNKINPGGGMVKVAAGQKTLVPCGLPPEPPVNIGSAQASSMAGVAVSVAGALAVVGGTVGGVAAGGGIGGGNAVVPKISSSQ